MPLTKDQAEVYRVMGEVVAKFVLSMATALVFLGLGGVLIFNPSWPLATAETAVAFAIRQVFVHYFPKKTEAGGKALPSGRRIGDGKK